MIATGTPCCMARTIWVAWRVADDDSFLKQNTCTGVRNLTDNTTEGDYTIYSLTSRASSGPPDGDTSEDENPWVMVLGARVNNEDSSDVRVGCWLGGCHEGVGFPTFTLSADSFERWADVAYTPHAMMAAGIVFKAEAGDWEQVYSMPNPVAELFGFDFDAYGFEPAGFWRTDFVGNSLLPDDDVPNEFEIERDELESGEVRVTVETQDKEATKTLAFYSKSVTGWLTRYRFRWVGSYTSASTTPPLAALGPQEESVYLDVYYISCSAQPYLAQVTINGPAYYDGTGAVASWAATSSTCVSTWLPSLDEWLEFSFNGAGGVATNSIFDSALSYVHPVGWSVAPYTYRFGSTGSEANSLGTRGLNWPTEDIEDTRRCRVTAISKVT